MHPVTIVLLVILVILIGLLVGLYFFGTYDLGGLQLRGRHPAQ